MSNLQKQHDLLERNLPTFQPFHCQCNMEQIRCKTMHDSWSKIDHIAIERCFNSGKKT